MLPIFRYTFHRGEKSIGFPQAINFRSISEPDGLHRVPDAKCSTL